MENELSKDKPIQMMQALQDRSSSRLPEGDNWESSSLDSGLHSWVNGDLVWNTKTIVWKTKNKKNPFPCEFPRY